MLTGGPPSCPLQCKADRRREFAYLGWDWFDKNDVPSVLVYPLDDRAHLARRELSVVFRQLLTRLPDIEVTGDPVPLQALGIPLVGGIKHLPVRFTPTARVGGHS